MTPSGKLRKSFSKLCHYLLSAFCHRRPSPDWESFILPATSTSLAFHSLRGLCQSPPSGPQAWCHPSPCLTSFRCWVPRGGMLCCFVYGCIYTQEYGIEAWIYMVMRWHMPGTRSIPCSAMPFSMVPFTQPTKLLWPADISSRLQNWNCSAFWHPVPDLCSPHAGPYFSVTLRAYDSSPPPLSLQGQLGTGHLTFSPWLVFCNLSVTSRLENYTWLAIPQKPILQTDRAK